MSSCVTFVFFVVIYSVLLTLTDLNRGPSDYESDALTN